MGRLGRVHASRVLSCLLLPRQMEDPTRPKKKVTQKELITLLLQRPATIAFRSYLFGAALSTAPAFLSLWLRAISSRSFGVAFLKSKALLARTVKNRLALFLATMTGSFTFLNAAFRLVLRRRHLGNALDRNGNLSTDSAREMAPTFAAGAIAGAGALLLLSNRVDISLFASVRAVDFLLERAYKQGKLSWVPKPLAHQADAVLFAFSAGEILFSFFYHPEALPKSYVQWIAKMSGANLSLVGAMRLIRNGEFYGPQGKKHAWILGEYCDKIGLPREMGDGSIGMIPCLVVHRGQPGGCEVNAMIRCAKSFVRAFKVYLPVHLAPILLFRTRSILNVNTVVPTLCRVLIASIRSSSFLALFIFGAWYNICLLRTRLGGPLNLPLSWRDGNALPPYLGGIIYGLLSIQLERKARRGEMGLYCAPRALYSGWWRLKQYLKIERGIPNAEVALFAASVGVLLTAMEHDKEAVRSSTRGLLAWILMDNTTSV